MKRIGFLTLCLIFFLMMSQVNYSREFRVNQIPNGSKVQCQNCHVNVDPDKQGSVRNAFGKVVEKSYLDNNIKSIANVKWGPELAALDSDGDGVSNGEELGDPDGSWKKGQPDPGSFNLVSNPGDPTSKPPTAYVFDRNNLPATFAVSAISLYPNPMQQLSNINYTLQLPALMKMELYDANGNFIIQLMNEYQFSGNHSIMFSGTDRYGSKLSTGLYFLYIWADNNAIIENLYIVK